MDFAFRFLFSASVAVTLTCLASHTSSKQGAASFSSSSSSSSSSSTSSASSLESRSAVLSADDRRRIEDVIEETMRCRRLAGLTLSIVSLEDGVLVERGFGWANVSSRSKVTENTLFPIASTTKAFTSTLLAMLIDKHEQLETRFDWNTPVKQLLGESFALYNNLLTSHVTLEDLLAHRTGIPDYFLLLMAPYPDALTRKQLVHSLRYHKPEAAFRTQFLYNNHMYALAGYVAEVLEGESWERLVRSRILEPLDMTSTRFVSEVVDSSVPNRIAASYGFLDGQLKPVDIDFLHQVDVAGPAGSIVSTAHDMAKWMLFHLSGGRRSLNDTKSMFSQKLMHTYTEQNAGSGRQLNERGLFRPKNPISDVHIAYALGWMTNYYRGYKRIWHSGSISTYKSQLWLYPDSEIGIFVSSNSLSASVTNSLNQVMHFISDLLLGEQPWFNVSSIRSQCNASDHLDDAIHLSSDLPKDHLPRPHTDYTGVYVNQVFGNVTISYDAGSDALTLSMGRFLRAELHYSRPKDFFYAAHGGLLWFLKDRIPVRFGGGGGGGETLDHLQMPLGAPKETQHMITFAKTNRRGGGGDGEWGPPKTSLSVDKDDGGADECDCFCGGYASSTAARAVAAAAGIICWALVLDAVVLLLILKRLP